MVNYIPINVIPPELAEKLAKPGPEEEGGGDGAQEGGDDGRDGSRWNALRDGLRARVLFPEMMLPLIERHYQQIAAALGPIGEIQQWLCLEMARASAQIEAAARIELSDATRFFARIRAGWAEYRTEFVMAQAARLKRSPEDAARVLRKTRQGVEYTLEHLRGLQGVVAAHAGLNEQERQHLLDLLGRPESLRRNPTLCPAGDDPVKLAALIDGEIAKLETALKSDLIAQDQRERQDALDGLPVAADAATRRLNANMSRAKRRLNWARDLFLWLGSGGCPEGLIDPETKKSVTESVAAHVARARAAGAGHGASGDLAGVSPAGAPAPAAARTAAGAAAAGTPRAAAPSAEEIESINRQAARFTEAFVADVLGKKLAVPAAAAAPAGQAVARPQERPAPRR